MLSLREQYCERKVRMNHLVTAIMRFTANAACSSLVVPLPMAFGAIKRSGCSPQYCEYSTKEVGDKMKGGAVNDDKSPLYEAIDLRNEVHEADRAILRDTCGLAGMGSSDARFDRQKFESKVFWCRSEGP